MKKYRILAMAPYEGMRGLIELTVSNRNDVDVSIYVGDLTEGAHLVEELQDHGYDAILSRGGTAEMIEKIAKVPVVDIPISAFDMLRVIQLTKDYAGRLAVVGFPSITNCAKLLCDLLQYEVSIFTIHDLGELEQQLAALKNEGYSLVIGDKITTEQAQQSGMNTILLTSGRESINNAFDQVIKLCQFFKTEKKRLANIEAFFRGMDLRVAAFTPEGENVYNTLLPKEHENLNKLMLKNIPLVLAQKRMKLVKAVNNETWEIRASCVKCDEALYAVYYVGDEYRWELPEDSGIKIHNRIENTLKSFDTFYDKSEAMKELVDSARHYSETLHPVLILGEEGTGKDTVASAIYANSPYQANPLVTIDCPLMTHRKWNQLFESEKSPLMESKLTIYFKSIHQLDQELQKRLVDYIRSTSIQKRNRLLFTFACQAEDDGENHLLCKFLKRQLVALTLRLPPLRERRAGIPSMAALYISQLTQQGMKQVAGFTPGAMEKLQAFDWKYNIDQFKRVLSELVVVSEAPYITEREVMAVLRKEERIISSDHFGIDLDRTLEEITRDIILAVLQQENMNQSQTAKRLGIGRSTLWRILGSR